MQRASVRASVTDLATVLPQLDAALFRVPDIGHFLATNASLHTLRFLLLYGSLPKAFTEFDEVGRMKHSAYFDRVVDVMEELVKFILLTRDVDPCLVDRYSERKESAEELVKHVTQSSI